MSWNKLNLHCRLTLHLLETEGCVFFVISAVHFLKENSNIQLASAAVCNELNSCGGVDVTKCLLGKPESSKWSFLSRGDTVAKRQEYFNLSHFVLPLELRDLSHVRVYFTSSCHSRENSRQLAAYGNGERRKLNENSNFSVWFVVYASSLLHNLDLSQSIPEFNSTLCKNLWKLIIVSIFCSNRFLCGKRSLSNSYLFCNEKSCAGWLCVASSTATVRNQYCYVSNSYSLLLFHLHLQGGLSECFWPCSWISMQMAFLTRG